MDPITTMAVSQAISGTLNYLLSENPGDAALKYTEQVPGTVTPYFQPYIDAGLRSLSRLENEYGNLMSNPSGVMSRIPGDIYGNNYEQSPGYQWQYNNSMNASNNAAAAGGMLGSSAHQQQSAQQANDLANQDFYKYLAQQLGIFSQGSDLYKTGLSGMSGLNTMGYNASSSLADILFQNLNNQAGYAAQSAQANNSMLGGFNGSIF